MRWGRVKNMISAVNEEAMFFRFGTIQDSNPKTFSELLATDDLIPI